MSVCQATHVQLEESVMAPCKNVISIYEDGRNKCIGTLNDDKCEQIQNQINLNV